MVVSKRGQEAGVCAAACIVAEYNASIAIPEVPLDRDAGEMGQRATHDHSKAVLPDLHADLPVPVRQNAEDAQHRRHAQHSARTLVAFQDMPLQRVPSRGRDAARRYARFAIATCVTGVSQRTGSRSLFSKPSRTAP